MSALVLLSGGLDSAVALADLVDRDVEPVALSVDYGQRHRREIDSAHLIASMYGVEHVVLDLTGWGALVAGSSSLTGAATALVGADTVVPNRNAMFIAAAGSVAYARHLESVVVAVHADDHEFYPDCRLDFLDAAGDMLRCATGGRVALCAPFAKWSRRRIVEHGSDLAVPFGHTWSCYAGGDVQCGECGACQGRRSAFRSAGIPDPTAYASELAPCS